MTTKTPPPPLPFGAEGSLPTKVADREYFLGSENNKSITQLSQLVGQKIYDQLNIAGEIGTGAVDSGWSKTGSTINPGAETTNIVRQPFLLTCQSWMEANRYIIWHANPGEIAWRMPQRSATQKTRVGETLHIWKDKFRSTYYSEPELTITFQSGNIMPIRMLPLVATSKVQQVVHSIEVERGVREQSTKEIKQVEVSNVLKVLKNNDHEVQPLVPPGLDNFYRFLALVDEQKILDDGRINYVYMVYNSRIFPNLTLAGLFTPEGVSWADRAESPNEVSSWTANFTVYDSYPRLSNYGSLVDFFMSAGFGRI